MARSSTFVENLTGLKGWQIAIAIVCTVALAYYISQLLFGNASISTLLQISSYDSYLADEIARLKLENATLQKEYFDLLELSAPQEQ